MLSDGSKQVRVDGAGRCGSRNRGYTSGTAASDWSEDCQRLFKQTAWARQTLRPRGIICLRDCVADVNLELSRRMHGSR